jgi:hypothetical protein
MDSTSIITIIVLLVICVLLAVIMKIYNIKKRKEALTGLISLAAENGSSITFSDNWKGYSTNTKIAVDSNKLWLFFIRKINDTENKLTLDLSEVKKVNIINNSRSAGEGKNKQTVIDSVNLELSFKAKDKPAIRLEFYNNEFDSLQLSNELQLAEKWATLINKAIEN